VKKEQSIAIAVGISIAVIILVVLLISSPKSEQVDRNNMSNNQELDLGKKLDNQEINAEIKAKYDKIEKNKLINNTTWKPKDPEWQASGPFQIDDSKYAIGQKIFLVIGDLDPKEKGQIVFLRQSNATHYTVYMSIPFDGAKKSQFNFYLEPKILKDRGICTVDDLSKKWTLNFRGTDWPNLNFEITKEIVPGTDVTPAC